jgi:hypothetical protein
MTRELRKLAHLEKKKESETLKKGRPTPEESKKRSCARQKGRDNKRKRETVD